MVLFEERQKFNQWWLWAILIASIFVTALAVYPMFSNDQRWGAIALIGVPLVIAVAIASLTMTTRLFANRIEVGFTPFFTRIIPIEEVVNATVRTYNPIGEYGGWGWRYGANGQAYNVMGDKGLQLEMASGKKLLIGTQRPEELASALSTFWNTDRVFKQEQEVSSGQKIYEIDTKKRVAPK